MSDLVVVQVGGVHVPYCNYRCRRSGHWLLNTTADRNTAMHIHDTWMGRECAECLRRDNQ